jgi:hypothetical protein
MAARPSLGRALAYPSLLAAVSYVAHPEWRASSVGVHRLWRDGGYAVGAILAGLLAEGPGVGGGHRCHRRVNLPVGRRRGRGDV